MVEFGLTEVTGPAVALHDDTAAGVGDVVATRRNDRRLATRANAGPGGYVRNRDRWVVRDMGDDGSLVIDAVGRSGEAVRLPASYVAEHVELAYADTGHGVQGRTVGRAEVLVRPSDTRWYLYVAMSRARAGSVAHVVVDHVDDEPGGYHPQRSARDVLAEVLGRDEPVSVTEWGRAAAAQRDPVLLASRYRLAQSEELRARLARDRHRPVGHDQGGGNDPLARALWVLVVGSRPLTSSRSGDGIGRYRAAAGSQANASPTQRSVGGAGNALTTESVPLNNAHGGD